MTVLQRSDRRQSVDEIAHRALVMREGEVCEEGGTDELFAAARHPYTRELLAAIPELLPART